MNRARSQSTPVAACIVHVARGTITVNGEVLAAGDALKITDATPLSLTDGSDAEVLVFDLPGESH